MGTLFGLICVPAAALVGAFVAGLTMANRPRLFLVTFLPLAILFLGFAIAGDVLRTMDRPRHFVMEVGGTEGANFVGTASVDGQVQKLKGIIPGKYEFDGFKVESIFALVNPDGKADIAVVALADGRSLSSGGTSQTGLRLDLSSFGYSEQWGGTSIHWTRMTDDEANNFVKDQFDR
jgi:hypothetical protein